MTDATATPHPGSEAHIDNAPKPQDSNTSHSWAGEFAASVWGAARVVGDVAVGVAHEVVEHPLKTAAEVGTGVVLAAGAAELGIGVAAGAAVGGVLLAGYGVVRGVQIAATEGVGAIPAHMKAGYEEAKHSAGAVLSAASTVYHGEKGQKGDQAAATLENVGRGAVPLAALTVGGAAGEVGQMVLRGGAQVLADTLPALSFEPAYAYAGGGIMGGAIARTAGKVGAEQVAVAAATGASAMHMSDASEGRAGNMSDYDRQQHFIEGKEPPAVGKAPEGPASQIGQGFKDIDRVMANGGRVGNLKYTAGKDGIYTVEFTDGPWKGRTGIWERGAKTFHLDGAGGRSPEFELP